MSSPVWTRKNYIDDAKAKELESKGEFNEIYRTLAILATVQDEIHRVGYISGAEIPIIRPNTTITHLCKSRYGHEVIIRLLVSDKGVHTTFIMIDGNPCQIISYPGGIETRAGAYIQSYDNGVVAYRPV